jgi:hypothetical protein
VICDPRRPIAQALVAAGFRGTYRGAPWTRDFREGVSCDGIL